MRRGFKPEWMADERKQSFPHVAYAMWALVDKNKAEHRGWFVLEAPTIKELKQYVKDNLFVALEADECPFRMTYEGRQLNWPLGIKEIEIKRIISEHAKENKRLEEVVGTVGECGNCLNAHVE